MTQRLVNSDGEVEDWELRGTFRVYPEPDLEPGSESEGEGKDEKA